MTKWAWRIAGELLYVAIVLYVFSRLNGREDVLLFSLIGLVYAQSGWRSVVEATRFNGFAQGLQLELDRVRATVQSDAPRTPPEVFVQIADANARLWLGGGRLAVTAAICTLKLLSALG